MFNDIYEKLIDTNDNKIELPTPQCESGVRETWIRAKYVSKLFVQPFKNLVVKKILSQSQTISAFQTNRITLEIAQIDVEMNGDEKEKYLDNEKIFIKNSTSLLHHASSYGDLSLILYAMALHADVNSVIEKIDLFAIPDTYGNGNELDPIHACNKFGFTPLIRAVCNG
jgi:hypothetical protein